MRLSSTTLWPRRQNWWGVDCDTALGLRGSGTMMPLGYAVFAGFIDNAELQIATCRNAHVGIGRVLPGGC